MAFAWRVCDGEALRPVLWCGDVDSLHVHILFDSRSTDHPPEPYTPDELEAKSGSL